MGNVSTRPPEGAIGGVTTKSPLATTSKSQQAPRRIETEVKIAPKDKPESFYNLPPGCLKPVEPPPSPTQLSLQLNALVDAFDDFPALADKVGFRPPQRPGAFFNLGLLSHDTGRLIASVHYNNQDHLEHKLTTAEFRIDPETCDIEIDAGWRLFDHLKALARHLNAAICDGLGAPLDQDQCRAVAVHIDSVMHRRDKARFNEKAIKLEDGCLLFQGPVSFQSITFDKTPGKPRSRKPRHNHFDVPALQYSAAYAKAYRMVEELRRNFEEHKLDRPSFALMLAAAFNVRPPEIDWIGSKETKENVVAAFLEVLQKVLANGLLNTNPKWLASKAAEYESYAERDLTKEVVERAEFSKRMQAAKAAKKARAEGGAA